MVKWREEHKTMEGKIEEYKKSLVLQCGVLNEQFIEISVRAERFCLMRYNDVILRASSVGTDFSSLLMYDGLTNDEREEILQAVKDVSLKIAERRRQMLNENLKKLDLKEV